jgi:hypothetical protein
MAGARSEHDPVTGEVHALSYTPGRDFVQHIVTGAVGRGAARPGAVGPIARRVRYLPRPARRSASAMAPEGAASRPPF